MAESFIQAAHGELTCPICMELFIEPHNPKNMPACSHVICEVCLNKLSEGKKRSFKIKCPECRKSTRITTGGVTSLKTNLRLRNLASLASQQPNIGREVKTGGLVPTCSQHDGEKMHYYCLSCNTLACQACLTLNHQGPNHEMQGAKERYLAKKDEMDIVMKKTNTQIESWQISVEHHIKLRERVQMLHDKEAAKITHCIQSRIAEIQKQGETLKGELQLVQQKTFKQIDTDIDRLKNLIVAAQKASHQATESLSDYHLITSENILANLNNTNAGDPAAANNQYVSAQFVEDPTPIRIIGSIVTQSRQLELVQSFGEFKRAQSVACSQDGLLAVCDLDDQQVAIYQKQEGKYKLKLKLLLHILDSKHQWRVVNVHICADGKILVARGKFLEVYSSTGMYQKALHTAPSKETKVILNSVTASAAGKIFAGDVHRCLVTEHDPTGRVVRSFPTTIKPRYITAVKETHIAMTDCESGKVSIIEKSTKKESLHKDVPEVNGICFDEKSDCILTVRNVEGDGPQRVKEGSGVIEQYCCKTGKLVSCLAEGLYHPTDLAFTADGMLAVTDHKTVKIYKVL